MKKDQFDTSLNDAQATKVAPVKAGDFCFDAYRDYCDELEQRCRRFMKSDSGILVYRRMRVAEVFSYGCRDMKQSLEWQLGGLKKSMDYEADVPNFLEPWYGLGVAATAYGIEYEWHPGQAPAVKPAIQTIDEALSYQYIPIKDTPEGRHTLHMIEYFLDQTRGQIPVSMGDIQSPFNNATYIMETGEFLMSMITQPEKVRQFLEILTCLEIDFYREQEKLIGDALARPGHGFASSRVFEGFGMSDDNIVMIDSQSYLDIVSPSLVKLGSTFGGPVLHSCGDYADKTGVLREIQGLKMVDAAFTSATDPNPNPAAPFVSKLSGSGIVLNARMVGDPDTVQATTKDLWEPGMKLIVVTYAPSPGEQQKTCRMVRSIAPMDSSSSA